MAGGTERLLKPGIYTLEEAAAAMREGSPLSQDEIRQLLRECVTVVKPGETLVVRGANWTPQHVREIQDCMDVMYREGLVAFKAMAVPGDELGIAEPEGVPGAA